jgi:hypothetical protein
VGFVFTPATSTVMSIVQIGGFYTDTSIRGVYYQQQGEKMIPAGIKAGSMAFNVLRTLYKGKKAIRKGASTSSKFLASKNMPGIAKGAEGVGKGVTKATRYTQKKLKKYPKTASAVGGAIAFDIFDDA